MKGREKREIPEKTRRPSSGTIPSCENPEVTWQGIKSRFVLLRGDQSNRSATAAPCSWERSHGDPRQIWDCRVSTNPTPAPCRAESAIAAPITCEVISSARVAVAPAQSNVERHRLATVLCVCCQPAAGERRIPEQLRSFDVVLQEPDQIFFSGDSVQGRVLVELDGCLTVQGQYSRTGTSCIIPADTAATRRTGETVHSIGEKLHRVRVEGQQHHAKARRARQGNTHQVTGCLAGVQGRGRREYPEKARQQAASSSTIPKCEDPGVSPPGIELGSPWASALKEAPWDMCATERENEEIQSSVTTYTTPKVVMTRHTIRRVSEDARVDCHLTDGACPGSLLNLTDGTVLHRKRIRINPVTPQEQHWTETTHRISLELPSITVRLVGEAYVNVPEESGQWDPVRRVTRLRHNLRRNKMPLLHATSRNLTPPTTIASVVLTSGMDPCGNPASKVKTRGSDKGDTNTHAYSPSSMPDSLSNDCSAPATPDDPQAAPDCCQQWGKAGAAGAAAAPRTRPRPRPRRRPDRQPAKFRSYEKYFDHKVFVFGHKYSSKPFCSSVEALVSSSRLNGQYPVAPTPSPIRDRMILAPKQDPV
ncbi:hypothetical protein PR048_003823 [Dryococelus australis]|uniref:Uncharacterized protein n=1 Tax=Dryococelus australis TaxID=614101 RepID=A0ABQ9IQR7_9NEOP|nr:hypothetical protein PR048_003823 [Dryococelus australis]